MSNGASDSDLDSDSGEESDLTSPVRSFLERSKRQVEKYLRQQLSLLEEPEEDEEEDEEMIFISRVPSNKKDEASISKEDSKVRHFFKGTFID